MNPLSNVRSAKRRESGFANDGKLILSSRRRRAPHLDANHLKRQRRVRHRLYSPPHFEVRPAGARQEPSVEIVVSHVAGNGNVDVTSIDERGVSDHCDRIDKERSRTEPLELLFGESGGRRHAP